MNWSRNVHHIPCALRQVCKLASWLEKQCVDGRIMSNKNAIKLRTHDGQLTALKDWKKL